MNKVYILPLAGSIITIALIVLSTIYYSKDKDGDNVEYSVVFNSATIERKIIGRHFNTISSRYLPPSEVKGTRKRGTFEATYSGIKVFTKGDAHLISGMTVSFTDSIATALTLNEPGSKKRMDARIVNLNPLAFKMIDSEIGTRDVSQDRGAAKGWEIPLLLLLGLLILILFGAGWLIVLTPLILFFMREIDEPVNWIATLVLAAISAWLWFPFLAYSQGNALLYIIIGIPAFLLLFFVLDRRDTSYDHIGPRTSPPTSEEKNRLNHLESLVKFIYNYNNSYEDFIGDYMPVLHSIAERLGISHTQLDSIVDPWEKLRRTNPDSESFSKLTVTFTIPNDSFTKKQYADDYARILACHRTSVSPSAISFLLDIMSNFGSEYKENFIARADAIARKEFDQQVKEINGMPGWYFVGPDGTSISIEQN